MKYAIVEKTFSAHMAIHAKQTIQQRLLLAPNITLALEVLRMPSMELQAFIRQQVDENPLLEVEDAVQDESDATSPDLPENTQETPEGADTDDWLSEWRNGAAEERSDEEDERQAWSVEQRLVRPQSLHESLRLQLGCQQVAAEQLRLGEALIQRLDEYGYLDGSLEDLAAELQAPADALEGVLKILQRLDPPGVGARDLRECLMIQLELQGEQETLAYRILRDHFKLFIQHHVSAIAKAVASPPAQVEAACASLKRLNPKPGRIFSGDLPPSVIPDLIVVRREKHYDVELNDQSVPHVAISRTYHRMLKNPETPQDAKEFLTGKFRKAAWLIKAIDERNATLLAIGRCLISLQRDFVEQGPRALKPLTQAQVAGLIGRHSSTVSRAAAGKTMDTPYGVFRIEQFFASGVPQDRADEPPAAEEASASGAPRRRGAEHISDAHIKSEIQRLIAEEDTHSPLSDEALVHRLAQRRISVARRTIAKYRTSLKILPAHLRRRRL